MMTSLYQSVGAVDAIDWARVLCGHCVQNDWAKESNKSAPNFALSLNIAPQKLLGWLRRPQPWTSGDWKLHHDNTPAHVSHLVQSFWVKHQITQVSQPRYNPDLAPCDFWLFPKLKSPVKGKRLQTIDKLHENMTGQLIAIGRMVWGPKVPTLKGTEVSLSYHNVSCILNLLQ